MIWDIIDMILQLFNLFPNEEKDNKRLQEKK